MKNCPRCKAQIEDNASFCVHCMTSLEEKIQMGAIKKKNKGWLILTAALLVLVLIFLSSVIFIASPLLGGKKEPLPSSLLSSAEPISSQNAPSENESYSVLDDVDPVFTYVIENGNATITDISRDLYGEVEIPKTLGGAPATKIASGAFTSAYITSVVIPETVAEIEEGAFRYCTALETAKIKAPVATIEASCFIGCEFLKEIYLPASVKTIDRYAFDFCDNLTDVYYAGSENQKSKIEISEQKNVLPESLGNKALIDASWHYNVRF